MSVNFEDVQQQTYALICTVLGEHPVAELIARLIASEQAGIGDMPRYLGLSRRRYEALCERLFPGLTAPEPMSDKVAEPERADEIDELVRLFLGHANPRSSLHEDCAMILANGSMGNNHLWQDLGFWSRADLSKFIQTMFPALATKNDRDMKWKKFFYKQLCNQAGIYTCRSPSCEVCVDYDNCFGPEE